MNRGDLTGNVRYKRGWFDQLIVQVEYLAMQPYSGGWDHGSYCHPAKYKWRNVKVNDLPSLLKSVGEEQ